MSSPRVLTRRRLLVQGSAAGATLAFVPSAWGRLLTKRAAVGPGTFADGVASGEPAADAITFWSRLTTDRPVSGARLIVATDEGLNNTVATVTVPTRRAIDGSLKARVGGLQPDTVYHYAWESAQGNSPVGRTKTAKPADSAAMMRMAFSSCQNYPVGFFNGHQEAAALDPLDLYLFLGDYQYEYENTETRSDGFPTVDLQSYRDRYRIYREDKSLRELHRTQPMIHIWDDHEVEDNYTENNPRPSDLQRAAGYRVSFEWLPRMQFPGEQFRIYNRWQHGRMADVIMLDQRQYRTGDLDGQPRILLGRGQLDYLKARLKESPSTWKIVANQVMIAPLQVGVAGAGKDINPDQWDGYKAERNELLDFIAAEQIKNVVFLTGDIHTYMSNEVPQRPAPAGTYTSVATEYIGGSITSESLPVPSEAVNASNPWIKTFNGVDHGYAQIDLTAEENVVTYRVSDIQVEGDASRTLSKWRQPVNTNTPIQDSGSRSFRSGPAQEKQPTSDDAPNPALRKRRARWERYGERDLARRERAAARGGKKGGR
ncbi:MAG: alkaline phosphatase D family protein [Solirubrobacteraceae bacterium]